MATLTLQLSSVEIKHAVKADSYITGQIDKSSDMVKNAALAYNEQAGDDTYHENKLYRTLRGAVSKFEANMVEYIDPSAGASSLSDTLSSSTTDQFNIVFEVGNRFLNSVASTLASLAQEYIINVMLYTWWQPIKPALAKDYYEFAQESLAFCKRCLAKVPPVKNGVSASDATGEVTYPEVSDGGSSDDNTDGDNNNSEG